MWIDYGITKGDFYHKLGMGGEGTTPVPSGLSDTAASAERI